MKQAAHHAALIDSALRYVDDILARVARPARDGEGSVTVDTQAWQGTMAEVGEAAEKLGALLHCLQAGAVPDPSLDPSARPSRAVPRILIIDDESGILRATERALRGYDITCIEDARAALSRVQAGETWDLILCDVMMPTMDGVAFKQAVGVCNAALAQKVVFITGGAFGPASRRLAGSPVLEKPIATPELRQLVDRVLGRLSLAGEGLIALNQPASSRARVLVVDDEEMVGRALASALGGEHLVVCCTSARQALERLREGERFDVLLSDLAMPEMTGIELHRVLQVEYPELAAGAVFITGAAFTPSARTFFEHTENPWLNKPLDLSRLRALVRERLGQRRLG